MRVLIFGADGQVGHAAMQMAVSLDCSAIACTRAELDLTDTDAIGPFIAAQDVDAVLNASGYTAVDRAEDEPALAAALNVAAPAGMSAACARLGLPFVHYSTDYVFDGTSTTPYKEDDETAPQSVYGKTKRDGELAVQATGAAAAILRLSWVFSPHGQNFVKTMLRLADQHETLRVVDDQIGKPTPASAAAYAGLLALKALKNDPSLAGIYHYCGDTQTNWASFAKLILAEAGTNTHVEAIPTSAYPTKARRPAWSVLDTSKFEAAFGVQPPNWRNALKDVINDLRIDIGKGSQ